MHTCQRTGVHRVGETVHPPTLSLTPVLPADVEQLQTGAHVAQLHPRVDVASWGFVTQRGMQLHCVPWQIAWSVQVQVQVA